MRRFPYVPNAEIRRRCAAGSRRQEELRIIRETEEYLRQMEEENQVWNRVINRALGKK